MELELLFDFLEDIADHKFDSFVYNVEIVVLVEFIPAVEDVVDSFDVLCWVADLVIDNACLVHEEIVIHIYVLRSKIKGIPSKIVQFVHVDTIDLVTDYVEFPKPISLGLSTD